MSREAPDVISMVGTAPSASDTGRGLARRGMHTQVLPQHHPRNLTNFFKLPPPPRAVAAAAGPAPTSATRTPAAPLLARDASLPRNEPGPTKLPDNFSGVT